MRPQRYPARGALSTREAVYAAAMSAAHPLDPLSADEIREATTTVRDAVNPAASVQFVAVTLNEPAKTDASWATPGAPERHAAVTLHDRDDNTVTELTVSLSERRVLDQRVVEGVHAPFLVDEWEPFVAAIKADSRYRDALAARGITDLDLISIDPVPYGHWGDETTNGTRLCRATSFVRERLPGGNRHARHVEGLVCTVDLSKLEVLAVDDHGAVSIPPDPGEYEVEHLGELRDDLRTLEIHQPDGTSFSVEGWGVAWQKWRFRVGFNDREGLVLHQLGYEDAGRLRPILYRASYTELAVTYADASPGHWFMSFFDFGELQAGALANSLELGCDCLGSIHYFDVTLADASGEPYTIPNAICLHEEDFGTLWKHADLGERRAEVRRSRRLVISWIGTFGNYEYGFYWYLYQDGAIESEIKLTGILQTAVLEPGERPREWRARRAAGQRHEPSAPVQRSARLRPRRTREHGRGGMGRTAPARRHEPARHLLRLEAQAADERGRREAQRRPAASARLGRRQPERHERARRPGALSTRARAQR